MQSPWFALRVKSNHEALSSEILRHKGLPVFLPTYRCRKQWSDRIKVLDQPLFPGYLFCSFDPHNRLPVLTTPGVVQLVGAGKEPLPVEPREIEAIRAIVESGIPALPHPFLSVGQNVRIEKGPLAGLEGILQEFRRNYRIVLSIRLLQRAISAEVDSAWLEPQSPFASTARSQLQPGLPCRI